MKLSIKLEFSRSRRAPTIGTALRAVPTGIAHGLAQLVKVRVARRARPANRPPRYPTRAQRLISPRYPVRPARPEGPSGAEVFRSSAEFHSQMGTRVGSYHVSGGMWGGLTVVVGRTARVKFRGRSEGQTPVFRGKAGVARGRKVSNALKAATVLRSHGVNILALTEGELEAVGVAVQLLTMGAAPAVGDAAIEYLPTSGVSAMVATLVGATRGLGRVGAVLR